MSFFSKGNRPIPTDAEPPYHAVWSNFGLLFVTNFKLIPFLIPSLVCLAHFLMFGGMIFFVGALVLLLPAGPAVAAMYDVGYQLSRRLDKHERRSFLESYRLNFRQGVGNMALLLPFIAYLLLLMLVQGERPVWVTLCLILGSVLVMAFAILSFSQIALVQLPLRTIWKNALYLIPVTHWRCLLGAAAQILYLAALYQWLSATFLFFLFGGPAVVICWTAKGLWPGLEPVLVREEG